MYLDVNKSRFFESSARRWRLSKGYFPGELEVSKLRTDRLAEYPKEAKRISRISVATDSAHLHHHSYQALVVSIERSLTHKRYNLLEDLRVWGEVELRLSRWRTRRQSTGQRSSRLVGLNFPATRRLSWRSASVDCDGNTFVKMNRVDWTLKFTLTFPQMMYVSGETAEASAETTGMIEEIVRQQVIEMVCSV